VLDQPNLSSATPSCLGEVTIPLSELAASKSLDQWIPLCPQNFFQTAVGEIHLQIEYAFVPDETALLEQKRVVELYLKTVSAAIDHFRAKPEGMKLEGLFRVPGRLNNMQAMWDAIVNGTEPAQVMTGETFEDVGGLLKMCLRNLPVPVFPFEVFGKVTSLDPDSKTFLAEVSGVINTALTAPAQEVLRKLLAFLSEVATHAEVNKMSPTNLAVVIGPALIREEEDTLDMLTTLPKINKIVSKLIEHHDKLEK